MIDLAIIGAGPAGMSAAIRARELGLSVSLFDEQPAPGGQIYRNVTAPRSAKSAAVLGKDYAAGRSLAAAFTASGAEYHPRAAVWRIAEDGLSWTSPDGGGDLAARRVLVATGAIERPFALPGWILPGVMTVGAAQILLKTSGSVADGAVFVGCGPLLYLVACQYLAAGAKIAAILDTADPLARMPALRHVVGAMRQPAMLWKGAMMLAQLRKAGVPRHRGVTGVAMEGEDAVCGIRWTSQGKTHRLDCAHVFLHQGVIPNVNITMAARAHHRWDKDQAGWVVDRDSFGRTSLPWLLVAGDGAGIGGAKAAALAGRLAACAVAADLGQLTQSAFDTAVATPLRLHAAQMAIRPFLDRLYRPLPEALAPVDDTTILCRCEEVTRATLARAVAEGCPGPNQFKAFSRAGMGPCQGRMCGPTVAAVIADLTGRDPADVGYYRLRMPIKPVTLADIAGQPKNSCGGTDCG